MAYVDTSVLVARLAPSDPIHAHSKNFLANARAPKVISPLTFEELSSVLARRERELEIPPFLQKEPLPRRIRALVEYVVQDSELILASELGSSRIRIGRRSATMPLEYSKAASLAPLLKLRALDLLHLAYAHLLDRLQINIKAFVTGDDGIISKTAEIKKSLDITVMHPRDAT